MDEVLWTCLDYDEDELQQLNAMCESLPTGVPRYCCAPEFELEC
jgi:hypothetical protein